MINCQSTVDKWLFLIYDDTQSIRKAMNKHPRKNNDPFRKVPVDARDLACFFAYILGAVFSKEIP